MQLRLCEEQFSDAAVTWTVGGAQGFVREASRTIVIEGRTPAELLDKLAAYKRKLSAPVVCLTYINGMPRCSKLHSRCRKRHLGNQVILFSTKLSVLGDLKSRFDPVLGHGQFWACFPDLAHFTYQRWVTLMLTCVFMLCCHEHWLHMHSRALAWATDSGPYALLCSSSVPAGIG